MEDQECNQAYERLLGIIGEIGLGWVAEQVIEEVRLGRTVQREVETFRGGRPASALVDLGPREYPLEYRRGPRATFPVTEEYRPPERLRLLLGAIEQAVVNTADMEHEFLERFGSTLGISEGVSFSSEEGVGESMRIGARQSIPRIEASRKLRGLFDALRREI